MQEILVKGKIYTLFLYILMIFICFLHTKKLAIHKLIIVNTFKIIEVYKNIWAEIKILHVQRTIILNI